MPLHDAGTVAFFATHVTPNWPENDCEYTFPTVRADGVSVSAKKRPDHTLEVTISGPFAHSFSFRHPLPVSKCGAKGLHVGVTWKDSVVQLYLGGEPVDSVTLPPETEPPPE
jgi:hypothetical protein